MTFSKSSKAGSGKPAGEKFHVAPGSSVADILRQSPLDPVDTRILLSHALDLSRVQLITQSERPLSIDEAARVSALLRRRIAGEPVAYLTGEREFYGLPFIVTPDVLIPRPETELLVELALERLPRNGSVLDLGTGSGAIAIALAHERPDVAVTALDSSDAALAVAGRNARRNLQADANIVFILGDWYAALPENVRFDLVVGNPPYIAANDRHLVQGDLRFEPRQALTDHADGLSAIRKIVAGAASHLYPGGWLLLEHGYDQAEAVRDMLAGHGFESVQSWRDLAGIERVSGGVLKMGEQAASA